MRRSHQRLVDHGTGGSGTGGSAAARDALVHFFEDAYHFKDWLKNDQPQASARIERDVKDDPALRLCADLCNGVKHLTLTTTKTGDLATAVISQSVMINVGREAEHSWTARSNGVSYDVEQLANDIFAAWERWLRAKHLL
jgi:hypothetical protein